MRLVLLASALLALAAAGTPIGIALGIPAEFGGTHDAATVSSDWMTAGTGISPPLAALVVLAVCIALALLRGLLAAIGTIGLAVVALVAAVGAVGEIPHHAVSGAARVFQIGWNLAGAALGIAVALLALRRLVSLAARRSARRVA